MENTSSQMAFHQFPREIWTEILFSVERAETFDELILAFPELLPVLKKAKGVDSKWNVAKIIPSLMETLSRKEVCSMRQVCKPWRNAIDKYFEEKHFLSIGINQRNEFPFVVSLPQDEKTVKLVDDVCCTAKSARIFSRKLLLRVTERQLLPCSSIFGREDFIPVLDGITQLEIQHGTTTSGKRQRQNIAVHSSEDFYSSVFENLKNLKELRIDIITDSITAGFLKCGKMFETLRGIQIDAKVDDRDLLNDRLILERRCENLKYYASVGSFNMEKLMGANCVAENFQHLTDFSVLNGCASEVLEFIAKWRMASLERLRVHCCCDVLSFVNLLVRVCATHPSLVHVEVHLVANVNFQQQHQQQQKQKQKVKSATKCCKTMFLGLTTIDILCYNLNYNFDFLAGLCHLKRLVLRYFSGETFESLLQVQLSTEPLVDSSLWELLPSLEELEVKVYLDSEDTGPRTLALETERKNCKTVTCTRDMYEKALASGETMGTPFWIKYCVHGILEREHGEDVSEDSSSSSAISGDSSTEISSASDLEFDFI